MTRFAYMNAVLELLPVENRRIDVMYLEGPHAESIISRYPITRAYHPSASGKCMIHFSRWNGT